MVAADGSFVVFRRYREIITAVAADQGGADRLSEAQLQLIRRFAGTAVLAEQMDARLVRGEEIDITEYALMCNTLVRLAQTIGLNRIPRDLSPTLAEYLRSQQLEGSE